MDLTSVMVVHVMLNKIDFFKQLEIYLCGDTRVWHFQSYFNGKQSRYF